MLSICIPTYNFDCRPLLSDLLQQAEAEKEELEIVVFDDNSLAEFQVLYLELDSKIVFKQLGQNVGRSKIRNMLAEKAKYEYLLFIDGDSSLIQKDFISNYLSLLKKQPEIEVLCGGSCYAEQAATEKELLRWKYSKSRENKSSAFLKSYPYQSFTTNNFVIKKSVFLDIRFEERLTEYGHEDTLFGFELKRNKIRIQHVDNPVLNGDLDGNEQFLEKTKQGISNLLKILDFLDYDEQFIQMVPLLKTYFRIKLFGLEIFLRWWFKVKRKNLENKFKRGGGSLRLFDFYRLGVLSILYRKR